MCAQKGFRFEGRLIAFEGIDSAGKSSVINRLPSLLRDCKMPVEVLGEKMSPLMELVTNDKLRDLTPFRKTYLFAADRAWTYDTRCRPLLKAGALVLWDRYTDSAIAYRGVDLGPSDGIGLDFVRQINAPFVRPNLTFFLDVSVNSSVRRSRQRDPSPYEADFLEKVRANYLEIAAAKDYVTIDAELDVDVVSEKVAGIIKDRFKEMF